MDSAAGPVLGGLAAMVIDGTSMIPLGAAAGVVFTVVRLTQRWQRLEDRLESQEERMDERFESHEKSVKSLVTLINSRPCMNNGACQKPEEK